MVAGSRPNPRPNPKPNLLIPTHTSLADDVLVDGGGEPLHGARQGRAEHADHVEEALVPVRVGLELRVRVRFRVRVRVGVRVRVLGYG